MNVSGLVFFWVTLILCFESFAAIVGLSIMRKEGDKIAVFLGDVHAHMIRAEPKSEEEIINGILERVDGRDIAPCSILVESQEDAKQLGIGDWPSILADLPERYRRAPFRKITLENIEMRGYGLAALRIHADPLFYKEKAGDESERRRYLDVLGYDTWLLTYEDVFNCFFQMYLDLSNKKELIVSEPAKKVYDDILSQTFKQFEDLKQHLSLPQGTSMDRTIVDFAYELGDKAWDLKYGLCRKPGTEAEEAREYEKKLDELLGSAFRGLFDLNAYYRILTLHESECRSILLPVGDGHRSAIGKMLVDIGYEVVSNVISSDGRGRRALLESDFLKMEGYLG
jgi:hypothetical protein